MDADADTPGVLNLAQRIRRLANGRSTLDVAQFQYIGIAGIRERYGDRWPAKRERVNQLARAFISRRIAPDDVVIQGADGFLLVFGSASGALADAAARRITRELNAFFVGEPDLNDIEIASTHNAMTIDGFADAFGDLLVGAFEPAPVPDLKLADFPMGYIPVWEAQRGALATYFISPLDPATHQPLGWDHQSHRHADMDERKLIESEAGMSALFAMGKRAIVGVAVHVSSLNNPQSLTRLLQTMAQFDRTAAANNRVLRISHVEPGYPRIYLEDMMRALRTLAPRIAIGLNWTEPDLASILKLQPSAVGFGIPPRAMFHPALRADLMERVRAAIEMAHAHNVMVGVEGDLYPEHAVAFMQMGVNFICSPRIWPVRANLPPAEHWPASRLLAVAGEAAA